MDRIEIDNGLVRAAFEKRDGGIVQEFFARDGEGWVLCARGLGRGTDAKRQVAGREGTIYEGGRETEYRWVTTEILREMRLVERAQEKSVVELEGSAGGAGITQTVTIEAGQRHAHVEVRAELPGKPARLDVLVAPFEAMIEGAPDVSHAPSYKRDANDVIGDRAFHGPAVWVQKGGLFAAIVPDLDAINEFPVFAKGARANITPKHFTFPIDEDCASMPAAMDLLLASGFCPRPLMAYGMMDVVSDVHVFWKRGPGAMVRELSSGRVRFAMDLFVQADAPAGRGYPIVARHLWRRYGAKFFRRPRPQAMPYERYARECYPPNFSYQGYDVQPGGTLVHRESPGPAGRVWQEWDEAGVPVGGLRLHAPQWYDLVYFTGWWNNACDATGLHWWGRRLGDGSLTAKARRIVNLAVLAPQNAGMFPSLYHLAEKRWIGSLWRPPREGYDPSARAAYWNWQNGAYQTASASVTAGYLMQYRRTCEDPGTIVPFVRRYGEFLMRVMGTEGCVPAWFDEELRPLPSLAWNADGGAHAWVLAELYRVTGQQEYLRAARRACEFLIAQVLPGQRWQDFEAFYSCAIKPETYRDERTGMGGRNMMCLSWALQGLTAVHEATGEKRYLEAALAAADYAAFFQACWAPHYVVTAYPFGGMTSQVGDAEWLDQRSHRFAEPLARLGLLSGRQDLLERGVAAGRSVLTLVNHPAHLANGIYEHPNFPFGLGPENIDHEGYPQMPCGSGPSWSTVGGLAGMAHLLEKLGGVYVDVERSLAVGVDGLAVEDCRAAGGTVAVKIVSQLAQLPHPHEGEYRTELRLAGLPAGRWRVAVNGGAPVALPEGNTGSVMLTVKGDGRVVTG